GRRGGGRDAALNAPEGRDVDEGDVDGDTAGGEIRDGAIRAAGHGAEGRAAGVARDVGAGGAGGGDVLLLVVPAVGDEQAVERGGVVHGATVAVLEEVGRAVQKELIKPVDGTGAAVVLRPEPEVNEIVAAGDRGSGADTDVVVAEGLRVSQKAAQQRRAR